MCLPFYPKPEHSLLEPQLPFLNLLVPGFLSLGLNGHLGQCLLRQSVNPRERLGPKWPSTHMTYPILATYSSVP